MKIINNKTQKLILLTLALLIVGGYVYKYFFQEVVTHHIKVNDCQISESSCEVFLDESKSLTIDISPKGMVPTKIMEIDVRLKGIDADKVIIDFEGIEIDHNLPSYNFDEVEDNHFNTKGFISLCTVRSMHWWANLVIFSGNESWKVSFPFETYSHMTPVAN